MVERVKGPQRARVGTIEELQAKGCLAGKVGSQPVCVFWSDGEAFAVDDRCPHMGFPLRRGTVENGLLTCHWHHAVSYTHLDVYKRQAPSHLDRGHLAGRSLRAPAPSLPRMSPGLVSWQLSLIHI